VLWGFNPPLEVLGRVGLGVVEDWWVVLEMLVKKLFVSGKGFDTVDAEYMVQPLNTVDV
jgi:hypothetical protein